MKKTCSKIQSQEEREGNILHLPSSSICHKEELTFTGTSFFYPPNYLTVSAGSKIWCERRKKKQKRFL